MLTKDQWETLGRYAEAFLGGVSEGFVLAALLAALAACCSGCGPAETGELEPDSGAQVDAGVPPMCLTPAATSQDCYDAAAILEKCCAARGGVPDGGWLVEWPADVLHQCPSLKFQGHLVDACGVLDLGIRQCDSAILEEACR